MQKSKVHLILPTLLIYGFFSNTLWAQKEDATWYLGYPGGTENFGASKISFLEDGSFESTKDTSFYRGFTDNNCVISNSQGNYVAAFNGYWINDASGKIMLNGDSIWFESLPYLYGYSDDDIPQGGLFLPWPNCPDSLILLYTSKGNAAWPNSAELASLHLFYALIKKSGNNGHGVVLERRNLILNDTIQYGRLTATRHANGRDWWILVNERFSNRIYRLLFSPSGIQKLDSQHVNIALIDGLGQAAFSPNGEYYAIKSSYGLSVGHSLDVFRFNRCTGHLSEQIQIKNEGSAVGGLSFSPNSEYLYVSYRNNIFQYFLKSSNIDSSKILIANVDPLFPSYTFNTMQLAPNNKIYICATNSMKFLHLINYPDKLGADCGFQPIGISLPTFNYASISYSPNFRLGPIDGSICDSLGINNNPNCRWRSEQDTLDPLQMYFHDLSYFEPSEWHWNFGDPASGFNNISNEQHPQHLFSTNGTYQVCLSVCNANACDTLCREIKLGNSHSENPEFLTQIQVSPNPFSSLLYVGNTSPLGNNNCVFRLYNQTGTLAREYKLPFGITEIDTKDLPPGMYFWNVESHMEILRSGKIIKLNE